MVYPASLGAKAPSGCSWLSHALNQSLLTNDGESLFQLQRLRMKLTFWSLLSTTLQALLSTLLSTCLLLTQRVNSTSALIVTHSSICNMGSQNRSAMVRIPTHSQASVATRAELRIPDPTANPYLANAVTLMAGLMKRVLASLEELVGGNPMIIHKPPLILRAALAASNSRISKMLLVSISSYLVSKGRSGVSSAPPLLIGILEILRWLLNNYPACVLCPFWTLFWFICSRGFWYVLCFSRRLPLFFLNCYRFMNWKITFTCLYWIE